jgi:excisionase family DNA binding protein
MDIQRPVNIGALEEARRAPAVPGLAETQPLKLLLTVDEGAAALGIGRTLFYELLMRGVIFSVKVGAARRVPLVALQAYVAQLCKEVS